MKLRKTASKQTIEISRKEWISIGKTAKWLSKMALNKKAFDEDEWGDISQYENMGEAPSLFDVNPDERREEKKQRLMDIIQAGDLTEKQIDAMLEAEGVTVEEIDEEDPASIAAMEEMAREDELAAQEQAAEEAEADAIEAARAKEIARQRREDEKRIDSLKGQEPIA